MIREVICAVWTFFRWLGAFIDLHWGDLCGMFLIVYGARLVMFSHGDTTASGLGQSLLLAGATILRPKSGNGQLQSAVNAARLGAEK